ncbi:MAG: nitroreductase family protein [Muribaculaceae bacterium]|nr:nitroreductase family protein [Muribaculaceae bacterium]
MTTFEDLKELLKADRSTRRFDASRKVSEEKLKNLIELTRYCASGRNAQPLKYIIVASPERCKKVYPLLKWAGYYTEWEGPAPEERPVAYLIQCLDTQYGKDCLCDDGLQLQAITLGATTLGLRGCIIKAFNAPELSKDLNIPPEYTPRYVLALGYPAEVISLEDMPDDDEADFKYYRTPDGTHHVPKRPLSSLIIDSDPD